MRAKLLITLILVASLLAGCSQTQQQKETPAPESESDGMGTATPGETNTTGNGTDSEQDSVDDLDMESNISEVENLIKDLEETEEINFSI